MRFFQGILLATVLAAFGLPAPIEAGPATAKPEVVAKTDKATTRKKRKPACATDACTRRARLHRALLGMELQAIGTPRGDATVQSVLGSSMSLDDAMAEAVSREGAKGAAGLATSGQGGEDGIGGLARGGGTGVVNGGGGAAIGGGRGGQRTRPSVKAVPGSDSVLSAHAMVKNVGLERCYRTLLARSPRWKGAVVATLRADAGCDVTSVTIEGAPDDLLRDCLEKALAGPVDRPGDGAIDGRLEIALDPGGLP